VPPTVKAVTPESEKKLAEFDAKIGTLDKQLKDHIANIGPHRPELLEAIAKMSSKDEPTAAVGIPLQKESETAAHVGVTGTTVAADATSAIPDWKDALFGRAAVFDGKQHLDYPLDFPKADKPFSWAVWVKPKGAGAILSRMDSSKRERGCDLFLFADRK